MSNLILLCTSDAGGARTLSPLAQLIQSKGYEYKVIASESSLPIFDPWPARVEKQAIQNYETAIKYLNSNKPLAVICGTTRYKSAERYLILAAKTLSIRSVVILDEWFNYHLRFQDEKGYLAYLPDKICCQDEQAKREAEAEGIPSHLLYITGSPSLANLADKAQQFISQEPEIPDFLKQKRNVPVVTFLSETHAFDYGSSPRDRGPLGPFLGYTENSVKEKIVNVLKRLDIKLIFVEKLHPSINDDSFYIEYLAKITEIKIKKADLWTLLWHSDLIIGMRSMALLESVILGCPTVSFQPGLIGPEQCTAVRLDLIKSLSSSSELEDWCRQQLYKKASKKKKSIKRPPFAREGAGEDVLRLALKKVESIN